MSDYLIFVDTNILLDFYRPGWESGLSVLRLFDRMHDRLITTYQIEMEFKSNRQGILLDTLAKLKISETLKSAGFLNETKAVTALNKSVSERNSRVKGLRTRLAKVLAHPTTSDPVYKIVQRLFRSSSSLNLKRDMPQRRRMKRAAFRRFILGYPPRKASDTSMGDALNWEWIVQVALDNPGRNVVIVSRDSDFGIKVNDQLHMNDWLIQEFRDRVSKKRKCLLRDRLSPALELIGVKVGKKAEREEEEFAAERLASSDPIGSSEFRMPMFHLPEFQNLALPDLRNFAGPAILRSMPKPADLGEMLSSMPKPIDLGEVFRSMPKPIDLGEVLRSMPKPVDLGEVLRSMPTNDLKELRRQYSVSFRQACVTKFC